jgi:hypothetical protein
MHIASSFLSSKSTIFEYDLQQGAAGTCQSDLLFFVDYQWQLRHFQKLEQIQVLIITATLINGLLTLFYTPPLFQIDVFGQNLAKQQQQHQQNNNNRPVVPERRRRRPPT